MNNSPRIWDKLLSEAPQGSVLMGGAVVDWFCLHGQMPKDFDIFHRYVPGMPELPENWEYIQPDPEVDNAADYAQGGDEHGNNPIGSVYNYWVTLEDEDLPVKVQLIGVMYEKPLLHFKNFDHSFTLGYYTRRGVFMHRKVFESYRNGVIEYVGKDKSAEAKAKSLLRAQNKALRYGDPYKFKGFE